MFRRIVKSGQTITLAALTAIVLFAPAAKAQQGESIKVHGDWTIEVRKSDGSLVTRHEFKNAYVPGPLLARLLARNTAVFRWRVALNSESGFVLDEGDVNLPEPGASRSTNLTVAVSGNSLVLSGTVTAIAAANIMHVRTVLVSKEGSFTPFSGTPVPPGIGVVEGQIIQVKVVISFS